MEARNVNVEAVSRAWATLVENVGVLKVIASEEEGVAMAAALDSLLDAVRGTDETGLDGLIELVSGLIEQFETRTLGESTASPAETLSLLMESNGLRQADLADEVGGQSVVSDILRGRRQINAKQAAKLATRFGVSAAVFVAKAEARPAPAEKLAKGSFSAPMPGQRQHIIVRGGAAAAVTRVRVDSESRIFVTARSPARVDTQSQVINYCFQD